MSSSPTSTPDISNIDAGPSFGQMRLLSVGTQTVGVIQLLKPSATVSNGVLTFSGLPLAAPLTFLSTQIVAADIEDSTGLVIASGLTVGPSTALISSWQILLSAPDRP